MSLIQIETKKTIVNLSNGKWKNDNTMIGANCFFHTKKILSTFRLVDLEIKHLQNAF